MLVWVVLRLCYHRNNESNIIMKSCPFFEKTELDYVYEVPSCIILICNTFFLIWIIMVSLICIYIQANLSIQIVLAKLRQQTVLDHHHRHFKAAKVEIMKIFSFCDEFPLTLMGVLAHRLQNFKTLQQLIMGELAMSRKKRERKRERERMPYIVATYVSACSQGQRTHSARTNL